MADLSKQTKKFVGVVTLINCDFLDLKEKEKTLCQFLGAECSWFATIIHALDIDLDGKFKTEHIHFVFETKKRVRVGTMLNRIAEALDVSPLAVTCSPCVSVNASVQYLIHKNDKDKYQYSKEEISTNLSPDELDMFLESDCNTLDVEFLISTCEACKSLTQVARVVGLSLYRAYRPVIMDIWRDCKGFNPTCKPPLENVSEA